MNEIWKPIPNFPGYAISDQGNVKSKERIVVAFNHKAQKYVESKYKGKILKQGTDKLGRKKVILSVGGETTNCRVHQLVAMAFLNYKKTGSPKGLIVDHINNNPSDNRLVNLQLITQRENCSKDKKRDLPTGVTLCDRPKTPYFAQVRVNGKSKYLGRFATPEEASESYQNFLSTLN